MVRKFLLILLGFGLALSTIGCSNTLNGVSVFLGNDGDSLIGCNNESNDIFEIENSEMVTFPINYFSPAMSSVPGQPIKLKLDNSLFECKIEHGSFEYYNDVKNTTIYSDGTIYYCPTYKRDEVFIHEYDTSFVDIIVNDENGIIGYAIVKIIYNESESNWNPQLLVSSLFINEYNNAINVSNDYLERIMTNYHKNLED